MVVFSLCLLLPEINRAYKGKELFKDLGKHLVLADTLEDVVHNVVRGLGI